MSYSKTTWQNGDLITSEKLNNIEMGIKTTSDTVDNAVTSGGIGYSDPDELVLAVGESSEIVVTIDPAAIVLESGVSYTFKIVSTLHPDGVLLTSEAISSSYGIQWGADVDVDDGSVNYAILYTDSINQVACVYNDNPVYPVSFYRPGEVHKIADSYLNSAPPMYVHFTMSDNDTYTADTPVGEIYGAFMDGRDVVGMMIDPPDYGIRYTLCNAGWNDRSGATFATFYTYITDYGTPYIEYLSGSSGSDVWTRTHV